MLEDTTGERVHDGAHIEISDTSSRERFTISELTAEFGVTARALRFYEEEGLISPARAGLQRIYSKRDRARLAWIVRAKNVGFSLGEAPSASQPGQVISPALAQADIAPALAAQDTTPVASRRGALKRHLAMPYVSFAALLPRRES